MQLALTGTYMIFVSSKMTGKTQPLARGAWAGKSGATVWKSRNIPISSKWAALILILYPGELDIRPRASRHVCAGRRKCLRPGFHRGEHSSTAPPKCFTGTCFTKTKFSNRTYNFEHADVDRIRERNSNSAEAECQLC